jgi:hypothetical protein
VFFIFGLLFCFILFYFILLTNKIYYKPETLFSEKARTTWVEPDLKPLPVPLYPYQDEPSPIPTQTPGHNADGATNDTTEHDADGGLRVFTVSVPVVVYKDSCIANNN